MSVVAYLIIASEIGFWVVIAAGLGLRYPARRPRAGAVLLAMVPVIDVVLLIAVGVDLHGGSPVGRTHQLAALYLGVSLAFGPSLVRWADRHAAHLFADGSRPGKAPKTGPAALRHELGSFARWLVAATLTLIMMGLLAVTVADGQQRAGLFEVLPLMGLVTVLWLVTGPIWVVGATITERLGSLGSGSS